MQHKTLEYQKNTIHYYISKKENFSNTLLFAHGLTADYSMFEKQVEYFKDKINIIYRDSILLILKEENINYVTLAGMSMGGWTCQFFAAKYHNMVSGFIAIDTTPLNYKYYSKLDIWLIKHISFFAKKINGKIYIKNKIFL